MCFRKGWSCYRGDSWERRRLAWGWREKDGEGNCLGDGVVEFVMWTEAWRGICMLEIRD